MPADFASLPPRIIDKSELKTVTEASCHISRRGQPIRRTTLKHLRRNVPCGLPSCGECSSCAKNEAERVLYYVVDWELFVNQIDVFEDGSLKNIIVLETVLASLKKNSLAIYRRVLNLINNKDACFYHFPNEYHIDIYEELTNQDTLASRNNRVIVNSFAFLAKHLNQSHEFVMLTNNFENYQQIAEDKQISFNQICLKNMIESDQKYHHLIDKMRTVDCESENKDLKYQNNFFTPHLTGIEIKHRLQQRTVIQGSFHRSLNNSNEAKVFIYDENWVNHLKTNWILISGFENLNRVLHLDVVAVELLPQNQWSSPSNLFDDESNSNNQVISVTNELDEIPGENCKTANEIDDNTNENKKAKILPEIVPSGKVVGIIKAKNGRYCGFIKPLIDTNKNSKKSGEESNQLGLSIATSKHLFVPLNKRIPVVEISTSQFDQLENSKIVVAIDNWPPNSQNPRGHFVKKLGATNSIKTESEVITIEHDLPKDNFSDEVLSCLPSENWTITPPDMVDRLDLRHIEVCSVDPPGCTDIDDALHSCILPNGNIEIGVHIADVTHFIKPNTPIDIEAANRGTSVYLVEKRIDMVPPLLSSFLCSLRENEDRLAFSVIFEVNPDTYDVLNFKFTKTAIRSRAAFTYEAAQRKIDDAQDNSELAQSLRRLLRMSKVLKRGREQNGLIKLSSTEVKLNFNESTGAIEEVGAKTVFETNSMIEEFMLLANIYAANTIKKAYPETALLRRHPAPPQTNFNNLVKVFKSIGINFDPTSGKSVARSIDEIEKQKDAHTSFISQILVTRSMMQAQYYCASYVPEIEQYHYGQGIKFYTHFTSPIRRYADVIVHRFLAATISDHGMESHHLINRRIVNDICRNINYRHRMAREAGRSSISAYVKSYLRSKTSDEDGYVFHIAQNAISIFVPKFSVETYLSDLGKEKLFEGVYFDDENKCLKNGNDEPILKYFQKVRVQIISDPNDPSGSKVLCKILKVY